MGGTANCGQTRSVVDIGVVCKNPRGSDDGERIVFDSLSKTGK